MVNPHVAFQRQQEWLRRHGVKVERDLQFIVYTRAITRAAEPAGGDPGTPISVQFPSNATLVLGIQGTCIPTGQPVNPFIAPNDRYRVAFQYNANSIGLVTPDGIPGGLASAVFGQYGDQFPARELSLEANDTIAATVQNVTPEEIRVSLAFHCLIWKFAQ
jgi:hypothetical protein